MKRSELRQMIQEEIQKVLTENKIFDYMKKNFKRGDYRIDKKRK